MGNQLFQFAFGLALQREHGSEVSYDISQFGLRNQGPNRRLEIASVLGQHRVIGGSVAASQRAATIRSDFASRYASLRIRNNVNHVEVENLVRPKYPPHRPNAGEITLYDGYWQNWAFIQKHWRHIRAQLEPLVALPKLGGESSPQSITVHIRRGDYLLAKNKTTFILQPPTYFIRGVDHIAKQLGKDVTVRVFTDDIAWASRINFGYPTDYPENNLQLTSREVMTRMSESDHYVISNSSFSWWAASLGHGMHENSLVVAPSRWFVNYADNLSHRLPSSWWTL